MEALPAAMNHTARRPMETRMEVKAADQLSDASPPVARGPSCPLALCTMKGFVLWETVLRVICPGAKWKNRMVFAYTMYRVALATPTRMLESRRIRDGFSPLG